MATEPGPLAPLRVLRHREFALFWSGHLVSMVGTWMQSFAQGWVVTGLTVSASALGLVHFFTAIPMLVLMPLGGVVADRRERRRILLYTQWIMLVLAALMGGLIAAGRLELWHVYVIGFGIGVASAYDMPAYQSFYPRLVPSEELSRAVSLNQATFHGSRILGPALAAWVIALWGNAGAFFANSASFLAVIASLLAIRPRPPADRSGGGAGAMLREGLRYVRERPRIMALLGLTAVTSLTVFPNLAILMPYYAKHVLGVGANGLGWLMSFSGGGALLGSLLLLGAPAGQRGVRIATAMATIVVMFCILAASKSLPLSVAATAIVSLAISHSMGLVSIIIQESVPDALRGRVMSLYSMMFIGVMPFAALLVPWLADLFGMRGELRGAAAFYAGSALVLAWCAIRWRGTDERDGEGDPPAIPQDEVRMDKEPAG